ncbi:type II toxin-antitoxin system YafQ family toxin [methanotrophic endosymbiont of Bathymodiolus puteoserpentis (Logatchev)]|jgi:addiction module RelE/StbE family toxin|uniref:type II toxin-antitoxin system RelE/ParE family toxin n=1 Tax=methanotrophic endosymbiont of Bathymodiolus puteoserpentis (Logatchev) TaxID=343235 RepID=UPI00157B7E82|nr:type II toxin-antitoxin system mRNA interferase toxin, RelE/StbE family [methanotrophic endosymbiont of Bathymodiolus puteoserpentis (Logatchev)]
MYTLEWTPSFIKAAKRFAKRHPELKQKTAIALLALEQDPFQPSLKLHGLEGKLKGVCAISITYSYRITLTLKISEHVITLLNIGDHNDVYRRE